MNYKDVIESKYNRENWQRLLRDIFGEKVVFLQTPREAKAKPDIARRAYFLGSISLAGGEKIAIYEAELEENIEIKRNKRGIRDMLISEWKNAGYQGAFMFCYQEGESVLRFSYVSEAFRFNEEGKYECVSTNTKRYTYLLGEGRGCRTAIERFEELKDSKKRLDDVTMAFSVETLTKQFYKDLFEWFEWATKPESRVSFPFVNNSEDDRKDIETKIIRLITRLMFVWFVKQKDIIPDKIFDKNHLKTILKDFDPNSRQSGNFYNAILQNLFFATLNRAIEDDEGNKRSFINGFKNEKTLYRYAEMFRISEAEVIDMFSCVPFLNGGLFECLDEVKTNDGYENHDGFFDDTETHQDEPNKRAFVPNRLFFEQEAGLISILSRYNFTIEENTPDDQQVALDPELLGKVFENLLGAYNEETKETARNQSGSFYTPREIVNYMVDESLISYLGNSPEIQSVFKNDFQPNESNKQLYSEIKNSLKSVKILDPACGSGAFPMGVLNRIVDIVQQLFPDEDIYKLKLYLIENCIYGCDIQSIATQITKLRFFISLICDCDKDPAKQNYGIPTLPNLETKFVSANTLIAKDDRHAKQLTLEDPIIEQTKQELSEVRHKHFAAITASKKKQLREEDKALRAKLANLLEQNGDFYPGEAEKLASWDPYNQNAVSSFFDSEWMFGVTDGFDIVIGNPPYIQLQNNSGELSGLYESRGYETFMKTGDIYCLFYERGWQLLKDGGHLCYITSNKWMRAGYGEKLRIFLAKNTNPEKLIDFAGVKIFESATVDTNILLFSKSKNKHKTLCAVTSKQNKNCVDNLSDFVEQNSTECDFNSGESWAILSPIEQSIKRKIEAVGTPLKDWNINIYRGVLTGCNEAFIISTKKRNEILANCQSEEERTRTAELIRPILRGRDIKRYGYEWADLWLINTHNGVRGKIPRINISDYPAIKAHLDKYWDKIVKRDDQGDTPYNLRNCAYLEDFNKPKIVWPSVGETFYSLVDKNLMLLDTNYFFSVDEKYAKYLLGVLNSNPITFWINSEDTPIGERAYRHYKYNLEKLSIPYVYETNSFDATVAKILKCQIENQNIAEYQATLNELVSKLYNLNSEENKFLDLD